MRLSSPHPESVQNSAEATPSLGTGTEAFQIGGFFLNNCTD